MIHSRSPQSVQESFHPPTEYKLPPDTTFVSTRIKFRIHDFLKLQTFRAPYWIFQTPVSRNGFGFVLDCWTGPLCRKLMVLLPNEEYSNQRDKHPPFPS
mmetsp:Transcript_6849/g.7890  ORF Transcript_6849/g.7890 Transcript_6849/m.7890 type:complete len:99 (+) Transcript_6849:45-341(+)